MDDAMRERANTALMREMVNIFRNLMSDDHKELDSSLTDLLVAFATSEADRRERECIEAVCFRCRDGDTPQRTTLPPGDTIWAHRNVITHDLSWDQKRCRAEYIYEAKHQREQGGK